jgi:hypothetical protein
LCSFGAFFPVLVSCANKNLATLPLTGCEACSCSLSHAHTNPLYQWATL